MFGLRYKLLAGLASLLIILTAVTLLTNSVLSRYSASIQNLFHQDYNSATAAQSMKESLDALLESALVQSSQATNAPRTAAATQAESDALVRQFERDLHTQEQIADLPGEQEATTRLAQAWQRFKSARAVLTAPNLTPARRQELFSTALLPAAADVRATAQRIIDMNLANMESGRGAAAASSRHARWVMHVLAVAGVAVAGVIVLLAGTVVLRPLGALEKSVRQIAAGHLDLHVPVRSGDEIGRLGIAFNDMAAQLREFKRVDHERLVRTQRTTQLAIDSLPDAVVVLNPQGIVELTNDTARRLFSLEPGAKIAALPMTWLSDLHLQALSENVQRPAGFTGAIRVRDDGAERFFLPRTYPIYDERRNVIGAAVVLVEVTELRRLDDMKNHLLSTAAHELKTPLTSMRMATHLIAEEQIGTLNPRQRELLLAAREDGERLYHIVQTLLDLNRLESGRAALELKPVTARELIKRGIESHRAELDARQLALHIDIAQDATVRADAEQFARVFANLISNAAKYTPPGGTITLGTRATGSSRDVHFYVADTGTGIPEAHQHRVFERFFRVPGQSGESGTGLGLPIVKNIIESHGGRVWIESREGRGTTVHFVLPAAVQQESHHDAGHRNAQENGRQREGETEAGADAAA